MGNARQAPDIAIVLPHAVSGVGFLGEAHSDKGLGLAAPTVHPGDDLLADVAALAEADHLPQADLQRDVLLADLADWFRKAGFDPKDLVRG